MNINMEKKWQLQIERGEMAFETSNYAVAEENYLQALEEAEQFLNNPAQAYTQGVPAIRSSLLIIFLKPSLFSL